LGEFVNIIKEQNTKMPVSQYSLASVLYEPTAELQFCFKYRIVLLSEFQNKTKKKQFGLGKAKWNT